MNKIIHHKLNKTTVHVNTNFFLCLLGIISISSRNRGVGGTSLER